MFLFGGQYSAIQFWIHFKRFWDNQKKCIKF
jgi:hypothetical protein